MSEAGNQGGFQLPGYRLGARIGGGGFSSVYEAVQLSLDRQVAVKLLYTDLGSPAERVRFERERQVLSRLGEHRHVVDIIDAGVTPEGRPFIVMRLYRRGSLADVLGRSGPMPVRTAVDITLKIASALQAAHDLGVLHRDVKPENIFLADDDEPGLGDFGIASLLDRGATTSTSFFTWAHVAPEVLEHPESRLVASDVYSLASTLYQLLAGHPAFVPANEIQRINMIMHAPPPPLGRADVPAAVEAVIAQGMAKQPAARFPTMTAFADALARAVTGTGTRDPITGEARTTPSGPVEPAATRYSATEAPTRPASSVLPPTPPLPQPGPRPVPDVPRGSRRTGPVVVAIAAAVVTLALAGFLLVPRLLGTGSDGGSTPAATGPSGSARTTPQASAAAAGSRPPIVISSDLPLQGSSKDASDAANQAMELYLAQLGNTVAGHPVTFRKYDNSTAAAAQWDSAQCQKNAATHVQNAAEVAVIGPFNSGCAKIEVPILNQAPGGPLLMVSHGNTNPGLTKPWEPGEPAKYYPTGTRSYARVVPTDDVQAVGAAQFAARRLGVRRVYVLDDNDIYGQGVARQFATSAKAAGITVLGQEAWDPRATDYRPLFTKIKALAPDAVFLGGSFDNNGTRLVEDKAAVLGDNTTVRLLAPDGFTGYPRFTTMPETEGAYLTFPGIATDQLRARGGAAAAFLDSYRTTYGADPASTYACYAVAALQVVLAAVEASDGTRKGVDQAVFSGAGVTVPAAKSVLGTKLTIDPRTGDVNVKDITVEVVRAGRETFAEVVSVP